MFVNALVLVLTAGLAAAIQPATPKVTEPTAPAPAAVPASTPAPAAASTAPIKTASDLLDALESADKDLTTLIADVRYDKIDGLTEDRQIRRGKLYFEAAAGERTSRRFAVRFLSLQLGDRLDDEEQLFVFDGQWLLEVTPKHKQIIKRQVAEKGSTFDPLKIGEGPLPLPIGQKKADILKRFTVELLPDAEGLEGMSEEDTASLKTFAKGSYQLKLVPEKGTPEAEKFTEVRLWYREGDAAEGQRRLLPRMARTVAPKSGNVTIVRLNKVETNTTIDPVNFATQEPGKDWDVVIEAMDK